MSNDPKIFEAKIVGDDQASGPMNRLARTVSALGKITQGMGAHVAGMGHVFHTAFGHAEHAAHGAGHAAHGAGKAIEGAGHAAQKAGPHIEHAAHPHVWMALAAHANLFKSHLGGVRAGLGEIGHSITEFLPALGALSAGGGLVGLFELTEKVAEGFSEANKAAIQAGMSGKQFAELSYAAKMTDVSVESMGSSMFKLNKIIASAAAGKNKDAARAFAQIGIHLRENGHLVDAAKILPELAEAFKNTEDPAMRARAAMALFGKSGAEMMPLLMAGREEIEAFSKESDHLRYPFTDADKKGLEGFHRSMIGLSTAMSGFTNEIGAKLAPVLQPVIEMATEWVVANRDWIATGITNKVQQLADWAKELIPHLREIIESTGEWIKSSVELGGHVGGLSTGLGALALVAGSPIIGAIAGLTTAFTGFGRLMIWVNAIMWANPWTYVAAGVLALGFAAYELYQHWDLAKEKMGEIWTWFGNNPWAQVALAVFAPFLAFPAEIVLHWDTLKTFFSDLWDVIAGLFTAGLAKIQPIIDSISAGVGFLENGWIGRQLHLDVAHSGGPSAAGDETSGAPTGSAPGYTLPSLYGPRAAGSGSAPAAARDGTIHAEVTFKNMPPGTSVQTSSTGAVSPPRLNVGYALAPIPGAM